MPPVSQHAPLPVRPLIGRDKDVAALLKGIDELASGTGGLLQIVGEPGIGKTRLLAEALGAAEDRGCVVAVGRGSEFERTMPFAPFIEALAPIVRRDHLEALSSAERTELAVLFPAHVEDKRLTAVPGERFWLHAAVRRLLELVSDWRPLLLTLDDLHWADRSTIELVASLTRRPPNGSMLLAVAYRPQQLRTENPDLAAALADAARESPATWLELQPLTRADAEHMLPASLTVEQRDLVFQQSGGNPLYLDELARAHTYLTDVESGEAEDAPTVPRAVLAAIAGEIAALSDRARALLSSAAIVGDPFEPSLAQQIAEVDDDQTRAALDELAGHELVHPTQQGLWRWRHPVVRHAVYQSFPQGSLWEAHASAARVLAVRNAPPAAQAHHVERSARQGDMAAIDLLMRAGKATAQRAPDSADRWFAAALRLLPDERDHDPLRIQLLAERARALAAIGKLEEAHAVLQHVLALAGEGTDEMRVIAARPVALIEHLLGHHEHAQRLLMRTLRALDQPNSSLTGDILVDLAAGGFFSLKWTDMRRWAREALGSPDLEPRSRAAAIGLFALSAYALGEIDEAFAHADRASAAIDALTDTELGLRLDAVYWVGWVEHCLGRFRDADRHGIRGLELCRATGQQSLVPGMLFVRAAAALSAGRIELASELADDAAEISLLSGNDLLRCWALDLQGLCDAARTGPAAAVARAREAHDRAAGSQSPWASTAYVGIAQVFLEGGEPARARSLLLDAHGSLRRLPLPMYEVRALAVLARAAIGEGDRTAAANWALAATRRAAQLGVPSHVAEAARAHAEVLVVNENHKETVAAARAAAAAGDRAGMPVEAAHARLIAGRALAASGDVAAAAAEARQARDELHAGGARVYLAEAELTLAHLDRPTHPSTHTPTRVGLESLSPREREIAALVADGFSNREIAEQLELSVRTVEVHLRNAFAKLELQSRAQLRSLVAARNGGSV